MNGQERWCGIQQYIADWEGGIMPPQENTPEKKLERGLEEVEELQDAVKNNDGSPESVHEIQAESADVIIRMIGIIISTGGNVVDLLEQKIKVIEEKYPVASIQQEMKRGVTYDVAMANHKREWQRQRPQQSA